MKNKNQFIKFEIPENEGKDMVDIIDGILKDNGLEEDDEDFVSKLDNNEEPRLIIVRDAARVLFEKKIPEEKLIEFLAKHLKCSKATSHKVISDIKEKLIPYAKIVEVKSEEEIEKERRESGARRFELESDEWGEKKLDESVKKKIFPLGKGAAPSRKPPSPEESWVKKPEVKSVETMAERIQPTKKFVREEPPSAPQPQQEGIPRAGQTPQAPQAPPGSPPPPRESGFKEEKKGEDAYRETID